LVTERSGQLRIISGGRLLPEPVMGTPTVWVRQDGGLLDVALHPDYRSNGWIYLTFTELRPGYVATAAEAAAQGRSVTSPSMTVVVRGRINADNEWVDTQEVFRAPAAIYSSSVIHYGSRLLFDQQGHLFYTLGERGNVPNAQDLSNPLGKVHRVNDDGTVPRDNPFVATPGAVPSIWTYGHRNPQGLSVDPVTGLLWESEHGPSGGDEINILEKGRNYGWGVVTMGIQPGLTLHSAPGMVQPAVYYTPAIAPSGIHFYTGNRYPRWKNSLFVAGLAGQQLRRLEIKGRDVVAQEVLFHQFGRVRTVTTGPDGLLYVLLQNPTGGSTGTSLSAATPGVVIRLVPVR
jgi:aldose sugar dehydrogenase